MSKRASKRVHNHWRNLLVWLPPKKIAAQRELREIEEKTEYDPEKHLLYVALI